MNRIADFFCSLKLTVVCLSAATVLVFAGTLAQKDMGLYAAQNLFFRSYVVHWTLPVVHVSIPVFPGGYLVGCALLLNLTAVFLNRLSFKAANIGTLMTHSGIILLLGGQLATDLFQVESHMRLTEGESKNYSESDRQTELVLIDRSNPSFDDLVSIPTAVLEKSKEIRNEKLPFTIQVTKYFPNSRIAQRAGNSDTNPPAATRGLGTNITLKSFPLAMQTDERNLPSAVVEFVTPQGSLGSWLVTAMLDEKQSFQVGQKEYQVLMRFARYYKPYSLELREFRFDKYKGTEIPKNFSSRVRVLNSATSEDREVLIYMNNPLRYGGETYYQSGYDEKDPRVTILQVVRNPGWLTPYISCALVSAGLVTQFMSHLLGFLTRKKIA